MDSARVGNERENSESVESQNPLDGADSTERKDQGH